MRDAIKKQESCQSVPLVRTGMYVVLSCFRQYSTVPCARPRGGVLNGCSSLRGWRLTQQFWLRVEPECVACELPTATRAQCTSKY